MTFMLFAGTTTLVSLICAAQDTALPVTPPHADAYEKALDEYDRRERDYLRHVALYTHAKFN